MITVIEIVKITEIIDVDEYVTEEYDFTIIYIIAGCATPLVLIVVICLYKKCKKQKAIHLTAMEERKPGFERDAMFIKKQPNSVEPQAGANDPGPEV